MHDTPQPPLFRDAIGFSTLRHIRHCHFAARLSLPPPFHAAAPEYMMMMRCHFFAPPRCACCHFRFSLIAAFTLFAAFADAADIAIFCRRLLFRLKMAALPLTLPPFSLISLCHILFRFRHYAMLRFHAASFRRHDATPCFLEAAIFDTAAAGFSLRLLPPPCFRMPPFRHDARYFAFSMLSCILLCDLLRLIRHFRQRWPPLLIRQRRLFSPLRHDVARLMLSPRRHYFRHAALSRPMLLFRCRVAADTPLSARHADAIADAIAYFHFACSFSPLRCYAF